MVIRNTQTVEPKLRTAARFAARGSLDLVALAYTQLRLARRTIEDVHLPWEPPQRPDRRMLTAARVRQAFPQLLLTLDTPANAPKPCGRSPGRPKGARSGRAPRFPAFKKAA